MNERRSTHHAVSPEAGARTTATAVSRPAVPSSELFKGCRELVIEHNGETYSLRQTSKGGLILTK